MRLIKNLKNVSTTIQCCHSTIQRVKPRVTLMQIQYKNMSVIHELQFQQTTAKTLTLTNLHKCEATSAATVRFLCKIKDKTSDCQEGCFMVEHRANGIEE